MNTLFLRLLLKKPDGLSHRSTRKLRPVAMGTRPIRQLHAMEFGCGPDRISTLSSWATSQRSWHATLASRSDEKHQNDFLTVVAWSLSGSSHY